MILLSLLLAVVKFAIVFVIVDLGVKLETLTLVGLFNPSQ